MRMFQERFREGGKIHPECGWHHPMVAVLEKIKREKMELAEYQNSSVS